MKFGRNVLEVYTHRLTESDFWCDALRSRWRPWGHFMQKSTAVWCICSSVCQFLSLLHSYLFVYPAI